MFDDRAGTPTLTLDRTLDSIDRSRTWENIWDDGSRADLMPYRRDLLRLDECGPPHRQDPHVL